MIYFEYNTNAIWHLLCWLVRKIWATEDEDTSSSFFYKENRMKILSVFVDESGDFGKVDNTSPYYLVSMIFHNQDINILPEIEKLITSLKHLNINQKFIHTGPIIRRENDYLYLSLDQRRSLVYKMRMFYLHAPIQHHTIIVNKKHADDKFQLNSLLTKEIKKMIDKNLEYFQSFDKIIVYYDNGQQELNMLLNTVLSITLTNVEFRRAQQNDYILLQLADYICTFELLNIKFNEKRLSKSENKFFYKSQELKKSFLKPLNNKRL